MRVAPSGLQAASLCVDSSHVGVTCVVVFGPKAAAKGSCDGEGKKEGCQGVENGVCDAETVAFDGSLCSKPNLLSDCDLDDSAETILEGSLLFFFFGSAEEEAAVWEHRGSVVADPAPADAKAEEDEGGGGGWRLEADELGHESLGTV